ncbi:MAG: DUF3526 domain-containing protein [Bacteroidota bacterium]
MLIPSMHAQLAFNELAGTSLVNHLNFLKHINSFHEETRLYFYPKIFSESEVKDINWEEFGPKYFDNKNRSNNWLLNLIPLFVGIALFAGLSIFSMRIRA